MEMPSVKWNLSFPYLTKKKKGGGKLIILNMMFTFP